MGRATRQEWAKRIERRQDSGLSAKEFAAEIDVPATSLSYWKWKLRQEGQAPIDASTDSVIDDRPPRTARPSELKKLRELTHPAPEPTRPANHGGSGKRGHGRRDLSKEQAPVETIIL